MAGGWIPAARLPLEDALAWAEGHLQEKVWDAYQKRFQSWCSFFAQRENPPDPPEPPED